LSCSIPSATDSRTGDRDDPYNLVDEREKVAKSSTLGFIANIWCSEHTIPSIPAMPWDWEPLNHDKWKGLATLLPFHFYFSMLR